MILQVEKRITLSPKLSRQVSLVEGVDGGSVDHIHALPRTTSPTSPPNACRGFRVRGVEFSIKIPDIEFCKSFRRCIGGWG